MTNRLIVIHLFQLKTIEALLGSTAKLGEVIVLGMVTQLKEVSGADSIHFRSDGDGEVENRRSNVTEN